jgi:hypothetical protein
MWKTLGGFTAQISRYQHILPLSTAQINCSGSDLPFFRKPYLANPGGNALLNKVLGSSRRTHFDKTDTQLYLCKSAIKHAGALKLAKGIYDEILSSNEFGSSRITKYAWTDEPGMSTSDISGAITIIADKGHPEQQLIPQL